MEIYNNNVFEAIAGICRLTTDLVELEAIWLDKPLQTARKLTRRITKGDMVLIEHGRLVNCDHNNPPTHIILSCWGTIYSGDLQVICEEIGGENTITVKL